MSMMLRCAFSTPAGRLPILLIALPCRRHYAELIFIGWMAHARRNRYMATARFLFQKCSQDRIFTILTRLKNVRQHSLILA